MLKLIEEDADSFAQRAEMYYKKRPELISMVESFYREHRSLAERYDQLKSDSGHRLLTTLGSPFLSKYQPYKLTSVMDQASDNQSESYDAADSAESEVDDPEHAESEVDDPEHGESEVDDPEHHDDIKIEEILKETREPEQKRESRVDKERSEIEYSNGVSNDELIKLKEEVERLKEENRFYKDQLLLKDEEKREAIRQLSMFIDLLKSEKLELQDSVNKGSRHKRSTSTMEKLKGMVFGKLFDRASKV
ncbi:hypothetical protein Tsubulata_025566 [Turnera subulata]|uniref:NAB domain-containing protein n=1 Tax=Turnera subulata TaxID=218843 RepID=A0A9Q0GD39_9ROSI|nr:hypothetical protein Tsubulata_025566 [Turnera subulata]